MLKHVKHSGIVANQENGIPGHILGGAAAGSTGLRRQAFIQLRSALDLWVLADRLDEPDRGVITFEGDGTVVIIRIDTSSNPIWGFHRR